MTRARLDTRPRAGAWRRVVSAVICAVVGSSTLTAALGITAQPASAGTTLNGTGSSFAAPAITQWDANVSHAPYALTINYSSTSSGQGRYEFTNATTDFAASDVGYVDASTGSVPPSFPFEFIPITAAGVAFMYNIPGIVQKVAGGTQGLQLTSYTACLVLTGQVSNWDDPVFERNGANANITLPNLPIAPVTEEDPAGTNYVLEEYCIDQQPTVWAQYAKNVASTTAEGVSINANAPGSNWVPPGDGYDVTSTATVASTVASEQGSIGAVQENYALDSGFTGTNPSQGVASVQNASGDFTQPTPVDVASALAYATQNPDGTHILNFNGAGPHVYNPSTYTYLLTPTTGWSAAKGAIMSAYVNYVLTLGQHQAPSMDFASLGLSLERYGIDKVTADVPGAVVPTAAEDLGYACGDFTIAEVQAGQAAVTCGVTNGVTPPPPPGAPAIATTPGSSSAASATTTTTLAATASTTKKKSTTTTVKKSGAVTTTTVKKSGAVTTTTVKKSGAVTTTVPTTTVPTSATVPRIAASSNTNTSGALSSNGETDTPNVTLTKTAPLAYTGFNPLPLVVFGAALLLFGGVGRRRALRRRRSV